MKNKKIIGGIIALATLVIIGILYGLELSALLLFLFWAHEMEKH